MSLICINSDNNTSVMFVNIGNYDHYIYAVVGINKIEHNLNMQIINIFNIEKATGFLGEIHPLLPRGEHNIKYYSKEVYNESRGRFVNLDYYSFYFKNIFLKMDIRGNEYEWLNYINVQKLLSYKQMIITHYKKFNNEITNKLNETHYIMYIQNNKTTKTVTYLRKDILINHNVDDGSANTSSYDDDNTYEKWGWAWDISLIQPEFQTIPLQVKAETQEEPEIFAEYTDNTENAENIEYTENEFKENLEYMQEIKEEYDDTTYDIDELREVNKDNPPKRKPLASILIKPPKNPLNNKLLPNSRK